MPGDLNDLNEAFAEADADVEGGQLGPAANGLDIADAVRLLNELISSELSRITDLSDDPDRNEERLRQHVFNIAFKAFVAGVYTGAEDSPVPQDGIVVVVPPESLQEIGLAAIRDGALSFHLVGANPEEIAGS